ncbi:rhomboid family intramembrane serine protease [Paracoccus gahaiensis]|uniref:Rhomboid family intramembrane serine protease n=1 Tax=Paracoccus gahaiensis TaxID=1706839 RepID=A0A4V5MWS7_9RHOB|nr:rhomboid family intramembrane serine protease [Paracoccus gahaiensis]TJZ92308.1 rhomboid family intramembrane serine protease [Paracoccus gahaiensis]
MTDPDRPVAIPAVPRPKDRPGRAPAPETTSTYRLGQGPLRLPLWLRAVILACCLVEGLLLAAPLLGLGSARAVSLMLGGFWSPLLGGGTGLYPGQGAVMFLTYGLLHAGLLHLAMNMISLAAVGRELTRMIGAGRMALIYLASQIGAGAVFALMQPQAGPMVGASGAVFGLAAALVGHAAITLRRRRRSMAPLVRAVALILGLNVALTLLMPSIAWEAHLGGALTGLALGLIFAILPRRA